MSASSTERMMDRKALRANPDEAKPSVDMSENDKQAVTDQSSGSAKVVHEVVRLQGDEELGRPVQSLLLPVLLPAWQ
jgi:hypothetical protein